MNNVTSISSKRTGAARTGASPRGVIRIHLLGMMRAVGPAGEDILPRARKTQAVLAFLCLAQGEPVLRSRLAGVIWDRSGEAQARESLRQALHELGRMGGWGLEKDHDTVRLDVSLCWIDAFETPEQSDLLLDSLYGISASFDQWLLGERVRLEQRWQMRLEQELDDLVTQRAVPELRAAAARKLLNLLPTHEAAVRCLMTAFVDLEECAQAIREYERFRLVVSRSLGISPSTKTVALYEAIRVESRARVATPADAARSRATRTDTVPEHEPRSVRFDDSGPDLPCDAQPSIAVLPFRDLSNERGHEYVAEGLADDLVEALSRVPSLFVISRLSAASFGGQERLPMEIGAALGVRYLLSGSIRLAGTQLRLIVELTDSATGTPLWISRFDEAIADFLDVQNRLAETVARSVAPHLRSAELKRVRIKRPEQQGAYDLLLRAQENMHNSSRTVFESAEQLFDQAMAREPHYAAALAWRAYWHVMRVGQGWSPDPERDTSQADRFAKLAVDCDAAEPMALAVQGHVATYLP